MKHLLLSAIVLATMSSCVVGKYYQLFETESEGGTIREGSLIFEDDEYMIGYNLWAEYGNAGFSFLNKTEGDIVIDMTRTFFVKNGLARPYFKNREIVTDLITTYDEMDAVVVPPNTMVAIVEYNISNGKYHDCDFRGAPTKKNIQSKTFNKESSPLVFRNIITYESVNGVSRVENEFYVNKISGLLPNDMKRFKREDECGRKYAEPIRYFHLESPDKYYIEIVATR